MTTTISTTTIEFSASELEKIIREYLIKEKNIEVDHVYFDLKTEYDGDYPNEVFSKARCVKTVTKNGL